MMPTPGRPHRAPPAQRSRGQWWILVLLLGLSGWRVAVAVHARIDRPAQGARDLQLQLETARRLRETGTLYESIPEERFNSPLILNKYPPTVPAIFSTFAHRPFRQVARYAFAIQLSLFLSCLAALLLDEETKSHRRLLMSLVVLNWQPFWEEGGGAGIEVLLLFLFTWAYILARRRMWATAGAALGAAVTLKIYPAILVLYYLIRRRQRVVWGGLVCAAVIVGLTGLVIPPGHFFSYLTQVMPRAGGTLLSFDNYSILAGFGRLALLGLADGATAHRMMADTWSPLESSGIEGIVPLAWGPYILWLILTAIVSVRRFRRAGLSATQGGEVLGFCLVVCLLPAVVPCSWPQYQTALALPLMIAVAHAPLVTADRVTWVLLVLAAVPCMVLNGNTSFYAEHWPLCATLRSLSPLWLWWALLRMAATLARVKPRGPGRRDG